MCDVKDLCTCCTKHVEISILDIKSSRLLRVFVAGISRMTDPPSDASTGEIHRNRVAIKQSPRWACLGFRFTRIRRELQY